MGRLARVMAAALAPTPAPPPSAIEAVQYGSADPVASPQGWFVRMLGGSTKASVAVSEAGSLRLPVVYACVNRIANPIASFPVKIRRYKQDGGTELVTDHPLSRALGQRPNPFMSSRTVRKAAQQHALLWGNGYMEIERNGRGQAVGLWPLLPDRTVPRRVGDALVYRTRVNGREIEIGQEDVVHLMDLSQDGYTGISPIGMAREAIGMGLAMEEFGAKFFANDAKSGGFLTHPGKLSSNAQRNLTGPAGERIPPPESPASRIERQSGLENAHRVKVLEEGMKFEATTIPPEDAQFLGSREFQIAEIARIFDVPLVLLQSHEKSTSWGSGIEQLMIGFLRQTVGPWIDAWEQELNEKLFTPDEQARGYHVKFNMNAWLRGDMAARSAFYKSLFEVGSLSPNKILAFEDMDPIGPEGDEHFVPVNFTTLGRAVNGQPAAAAAQGATI